MRRLITAAALCAAGLQSLQAGYLYDPLNPSPNGFLTPTFNFSAMVYEYSAWDIFYAPHTAGNFPDLFAPYGGVEVSPGVWAPETRSSAGFAPNSLYNPGNPLAFWDTRNATITQLATSAFIVGPDITGNIYTYQEKTRYVLQNSPDYGANGLGTVIFQFQTDGSLVDFSKVKLVYNDGAGGEVKIAANDPEIAEYLREYNTTGGNHWSASGGYSNRIAVQWDLSQIRDVNLNPLGSFKILWEATSSSMSLQKVDLVTADTYQAGIPISAKWVGGNGTWSSAANWSLHAGSGLTTPQANGNIRWQNPSAANVTLDSNRAIGEMIFESPNDVTITPAGASKITANTGVTTTEDATGTYKINSNYEMGALNFFEIRAGTVEMNGIVSGSYGLVKSGPGTLELNNNNTFTGFLGVQGGTVRLGGTNAYTGSTTVTNGTLIVAANAGSTGALGNSTNPVSVGADESLYQYIGGTLSAGLLIEGDHTVSRNVLLAAGNLSKRLGAFGTTNGATFSGAINFDATPANPDSGAGVASNVKLTAQNSTDRLIFSGAMTGGNSSSHITLDGQGTVVFSGTNKTYGNTTTVASGKLQIASGTSLSNTSLVSVSAGAELAVNGTLGGTGSLAINGGKISGSGTITRAFTLDSGDILAPGAGVGTLTTGDETWAGGGRFVLELTDADALAGAGWDLLNISGGLNLSASDAAPFVLQLSTVTAAGLAGLMLDFNSAESYAWKFATISGALSGFDSTDFTIDATGFQNAHQGTFFVTAVGNELFLNYQVVPEPSTALLLGLGGMALACRRRRLTTCSAHPDVQE